MRNCIVIHNGVQHSGSAARALHRRGRLLAMMTRLQVGDAPAGPLKYLSQASSHARRLLENRTVPGLPDQLIRRVGLVHEFVRRAPVIGRSLPLRRFLTNRFEAGCVRRLPADAEHLLLTDYAALRILLATADLGIQRVLDLSQPLPATIQEAIREDIDAHGFTPDSYNDRFAPAEDERVRQEVHLADKVIVASEFSRSSVLRERPDADVVVVPYGFDTPAPVIRPRRPGPPRLLFVGALSEHKGISVLAQAMRRLEADRSPVHLDVVGGAPGTAPLPDWPGNVTLHGRAGRGYVSRMFADADYLVLPSISEGFGRVIVEALSHGCGVITTERTAAPDILRDCPDAPIHINRVAERDRLAEVITAVTGTVDADEAQARRERAVAAAARYSHARYAETLDRIMTR
jgi:glycosyltransferase involved in cell wall biosynthesis